MRMRQKTKLKLNYIKLAGKHAFRVAKLISANSMPIGWKQVKNLGAVKKCGSNEKAFF